MDAEVRGLFAFWRRYFRHARPRWVDIGGGEPRISPLPLVALSGCCLAAFADQGIAVSFGCKLGGFLFSDRCRLSGFDRLNPESLSCDLGRFSNALSVCSRRGGCCCPALRVWTITLGFVAVHVHRG